jgi:hypothetical protein
MYKRKITEIIEVCAIKIEEIHRKEDLTDEELYINSNEEVNGLVAAELSEIASKFQKMGKVKFNT